MLSRFIALLLVGVFKVLMIELSSVILQCCYVLVTDCPAACYSINLRSINYSCLTPYDYTSAWSTFNREYGIQCTIEIRVVAFEYVCVCIYMLVFVCVCICRSFLSQSF